MVESVESTLHRSRLKARPSSKPPPLCEAFNRMPVTHLPASSIRGFVSSPSRPRYFIVNSHESQHGIASKGILFPWKRELAGICTSEELFPRSISTQPPPLPYQPLFELASLADQPPRSNLSLFHFRGREITRGKEEFSGTIVSPRFIVS